ncbi:MAG: hypothetical protein NUV60_02600 [Patescibacteria group bacterium]|nr:hypothetical protein [Patescibacteria group bacterium]
MAKVVKKRYAAKELELYRQVFAVLLSGEGSCLHTVENGFTYSLVNGPQHFAVGRLLAELKLPQEFADMAANEYLNRFQNTGHPMSRDTDAIEYVQRLAEQFPISRETAERLVGCMAEAGWYGRLEGCAHKYCGRAPTAEEVALLFKNYMEGASHGTSTDEALASYAKKYMSVRQAEEQLRLLEERNERFHSEIY